MFFGYNTNGFAHHTLPDALSILAELGYRGVALTLDYQHLNPFSADLPAQLRETRTLLEKYDLHCVIETGARFLLDPRRKHQPTLLSPTAEEREVRFEFLRRAVVIAQELGAGVVSFWSGAVLLPSPGFAGEGPRVRVPSSCEERRPSPPAPLPQSRERGELDLLADACRRLADLAAAANVRLAFEPEPGMAIDTMDRFAELHAAVDHPSFGLTLDVGHLHCQGEFPIADHIHRWRDWLWNVHIEDMRQGVHDHLPFGEGELDIAGVLAALRSAGYTEGVYVELSRHSHDAVETARRSLDYLHQHGP